MVVTFCFTAALGGLGTGSLFDRLTSGDPSVPGEAQTGQQLIAADATGGAQILVQTSGVDLSAPAAEHAVRATAKDIDALPSVLSVHAPLVSTGGLTSPAATALLAHGTPSSHAFLMIATLAHGLSPSEQRQAADTIRTKATRGLGSLEGSTVQVGGVPLLVAGITHQVEADLRAGEGIALPISLLLMVLVFGGFIAAGMPVLGAIASVAGGLASLLVFSLFIDLDATVVNIVTILGLGLSIDYGLLVVSRFREELALVAPGLAHDALAREAIVEATARTVASAGRTVLFSGLTVGISLSGLMVFAAPIMRAIGAAGASVVAVALLAALTLVPALCAVGARHLMRRGRDLSDDHGAFGALARGVQRAPALVVIATLAVLVIIATPVLGMRTTSSGTELLPPGSSQRVFFEDLARDYPAMSGPQVTVVAHAPMTEVVTWAAGFATLPGVTGVDTPTQLSGGYTSIGLHTDGGAMGDPARALVHHLRDTRPDFPSYVTGQAAGLIDFNAGVTTRAPIAIALVALATLVLLFLMTGSIVLPLKALILNVVSLGASLGVLVWVFQDGHLESLLGFSSVGAVEAMIPLLVLAFGFGLSMDYEVFLLSRIVELHDQGVSDARAVEIGLQRSGRIITSAALLIVIVFAGFAVGKLLIIKETGIALATAVLLDATLVRMLLVPATMTMLGRWNWWSPGPMRRWHERFGIHESVDTRARVPAPAPE